MNIDFPKEGLSIQSTVSEAYILFIGLSHSKGLVCIAHAVCHSACTCLTHEYIMHSTSRYVYFIRTIIPYTGTYCILRMYV